MSKSISIIYKNKSSILFQENNTSEKRDKREFPENYQREIDIKGIGKKYGYLNKQLFRNTPQVRIFFFIAVQVIFWVHLKTMKKHRRATKSHRQNPLNQGKTNSTIHKNNISLEIN